jgi:hypothetical protein
VKSDKSGLALIGRNKALAVEDIQVIKVASAEIKTESKSTITVDQCYIDKEVKLCTSVLKAKAIKTVES